MEHVINDVIHLNHTTEGIPHPNDVKDSGEYIIGWGAGWNKVPTDPQEVALPKGIYPSRER